MEKECVLHLCVDEYKKLHGLCCVCVCVWVMSLIPGGLQRWSRTTKKGCSARKEEKEDTLPFISLSSSCSSRGERVYSAHLSPSLCVSHSQRPFDAFQVD